MGSMNLIGAYIVPPLEDLSMLMDAFIMKMHSY